MAINDLARRVKRSPKTAEFDLRSWWIALILVLPLPQSGGPLFTRVNEHAD